ncbi:MAG: acyl-CoA thioesterase [Salinivirgaceae bacterium]|jgi:acyl-CoA thioester hydrolase|nr:acyl-CoA thioesterase [Bacteroidales bacterium]
MENTLKSPFIYETQYRIRYADTDQMGVVYYGKYALLYEIGRVELMRSVGITYAEMEREGTLMPVIEMNLKYIRPLRYDDVVTIKTILSETPAATIVFHHEIYDSKNVLCNEGYVKLCFVDTKTRRTKRIPYDVLNKLVTC